MTERKAIVVAGGAGAMGRITVRDLVETAADDVDVVIADYDLSAAKKLAKSFKRDVRPVRIDIHNVKGTAKALKGSFGVIGAVQHQLNLELMEACLGAGAHYCDLGGLFHYTRKQLKLDKKFTKAGLLAVLGVGAAPGVVNVMARAAADDMSEVHEIHVKVGNVDKTQGRPSSPLGTSYSLSTILDEANMPAALFTGGEFTFVEPMTGVEEIDFPAPVGRRRPAYTIHSEVATLPLSFADKGVREVSFRIAFSNELDERLRFLRALGASSDKAIVVGRKKTKVVPRDVLMALASQAPALPPFHGVPDEYEVLRVVVVGKANGKAVTETIDCHCPGMPAWGIGVDVDTGCPPSILMQMMARGDVPNMVGVQAPERAIPPAPFFKELEKRGMRIERSRIATAASAA
ncbi:MAG: saccharopine dehydrogenase C-terminal domain-containing protein [Deltaproteobacteria bacterium]|nr:saccharopine dehydrogenase C-terminal domain-containing protein [Deltaproteobacteria bacterium]